MARTIVVSEFGIKTKTQVSEIQVLSFNIPGEVAPDLCADRRIGANGGRLEKLCVDPVDFNYPALGKRDIEPQPVLHNLLINPGRKLWVIVG